MYFSTKLVDLWYSRPALPKKPLCPIKPKFTLGIKRTVGIIACFALFVCGAVIGEVEFFGDYLLLFVFCFIPCVLIYLNARCEYNRRINDYNQSILDYQSELRKYEKTKDVLLSPSNVYDYREKAVTHWLQDRKTGLNFVPTIYYYNNSDEVKKGYSELFFYEKLKQAFPSYTIKTNLKIPSDYLYYYPDIAIIAEGLFLDIEIDEPYSDEDGTPIHYIDELSISIDDERNRYFNRQGWEVVRFSEEQIIKKTDQCIEFISYLIKCIVTYDSSRCPVSSSFKRNKWTKGQASYMALNQFRKSYLGEDAT